MKKRRQHRWTDQQVELLKLHYPDSGSAELIKVFDGLLNHSQIRTKAKRLGIKKSHEYFLRNHINANGRFARGYIPANKGIKYDVGGRSKETRFKAGHKPANHRPVGSTIVTVDGYVAVKIGEGMHQWRFLHREIWKKHHGQYPPRGTALVFVDGNKQNCDISNLELLNRAQLMRRNSIQNYPEEIKEVIRLRSAISRRINGLKK